MGEPTRDLGFQSRPKLGLLGYGRFELLEPLVYISSRTWLVDDGQGGYGPTDEFIVPAGFHTDLASVPHWLASLAPSWDQTAGAGVLHDFTYRGGRMSRRLCDALFYEALRSPPATGRVRAWAMWAAVRAFGWPAWTTNKIARGLDL